MISALSIAMFFCFISSPCQHIFQIVKRVSYAIFTLASSQVPSSAPDISVASASTEMTVSSERHSRDFQGEEEQGRVQDSAAQLYSSAASLNQMCVLSVVRFSSRS